MSSLITFLRGVEWLEVGSNSELSEDTVVGALLCASVFFAPGVVGRKNFTGE